MKLLYTVKIVAYTLLVCFFLNVNLHADDEGVIPWEYSGELGPSAWGEISPDYKMCSEGQRQSPINIETIDVIDRLLPYIQFFYKPIPLSVTNTGHTIKVNNDGRNFIVIDEKKYQLIEFHFHLPSEHTINGKDFDMCVHFVHQSSDGQFAVLGIFLEKGSEKIQALDSILQSMPNESGLTFRESEKLIDISEFFPENKAYYTYDGSFTMPPCYEKVDWYVLKNPMSITDEQFEQFQSLYPGNSRPVMPLHGRKVYGSYEGKTSFFKQR